jgi:hypothetical protein
MISAVRSLTFVRARSRKSVLSALSLCASLALAPAEAQNAQNARLDTLQARLFYERTGEFSANIAPPAKFTAFNANIGAGDARQPANDLLVAVTLKSDKADVVVKSPVFLMIRDKKKDKVLVSRKFDMLFFKDVTLAKSLYVPDASCLGSVEIIAVFEGKKITHPLELNCGE